ncbi:FMN-linked oxidoreductase [Suillus hirtellus]|nr:FMN-linked oxidoreductase [Suillus hirtellus]
MALLASTIASGVMLGIGNIGILAGRLVTAPAIALEVTDAVVEAVGAERTGFRMSPWGVLNGMGMADPKPQFSYVVEKLRKHKLAYIHVVEPMPAEVTAEKNSDFLRDIWQDKKGGLIGFGRLFMPNPDLPLRLRKGIALERGDWATWYMGGNLTPAATVELTPFKRVTGVDPSSKMIKVAQGTFKNTPTSTGQYEYIQASAENLTFLEDSSVDLVISGIGHASTAFWKGQGQLRCWCLLGYARLATTKVARVLRKNGSVAFWGYSQLRLARYPSLTPRINAYVEGTDPLNSIGSYWEQPGRAILDNHLIEVPDANEVVPGAFSDFERVFTTGDYYPSSGCAFRIEEAHLA